jgi:prevent-host-death family protein
MSKTKVTSAEFQREFGRYRAIAHREAVTITAHGRDDVVLLAAEEYHRLRNLERHAMHVTDLSDDELRAIEGVQIPPEAAEHDREMI